MVPAIRYNLVVFKGKTTRIFTSIGAKVRYIAFLETLGFKKINAFTRNNPIFGVRKPKFDVIQRQILTLFFKILNTRYKNFKEQI
jgi:hypothetical protein